MDSEEVEILIKAYNVLVANQFYDLAKELRLVIGFVDVDNQFKAYESRLGR